MTEEKKISPRREVKRLEYMVAWRDRYIRTLEERLQGREEENLMMQALLFYALCSVGQKDEQGAVLVPINKQAVTDMLGAWRCETTDEGEAYLVTFTHVPGKEAGGPRGDEEKE